MNCCKLQIVFKNRAKLGNNFHFKGPIPKTVDPAMRPFMANKNW